MVFKRGFFLDLSNGEAQQAPVTVAPVKAAPEATKAKAQPKTAAPAAPATAVSAAPAAPATKSAETPASDVGSSGPSLTTAEAIAAELAAAQASRPAPSAVTFAPDCVTAGGALNRRRRSGGADLAGFREMARGMMGN